MMATQLSERVHIAEHALAAHRNLEGSRILVIMPSIPVQGMERSTLQIFKLMRSRGADVLFVTEQTYGQSVQREVERIGCKWTTASFALDFDERLHLSRNPLEMSRVFRAWARAALQIGRVCAEYRPTHVHITSVTAFLYALPLLWRVKARVVFRLPNPPGTTLAGLKRVLSDWIWRRCMRVCDMIVCNSRYTLSRLEKLGLRPRDARVIHNCLSDRVAPASNDAPTVRPGQFNIVYLGRIRPEKGVKELFEVALRIAREREDVDFYLAGEHHWMNPFAEDLIRQVEAKNLSSRIHFTGQIEDVFGLLKQCQLHVCPSTSEGESFPNVVLEAKSQGLASVVFPTSGIPEAVTHLVDGYVCADRSTQSLYEGICFYLNDRAALEAAGNAASESLARFSEDRISDQWASVFRTLVLECAALD